MLLVHVSLSPPLVLLEEEVLYHPMGDLVFELGPYGFKLLFMNTISLAGAVLTDSIVFSHQFQNISTYNSIQC